MNNKVNMVRIVDNTRPREDHESKKYLICIEETDGGKDWVVVIGRRSAYEYIIEMAEFINYEQSFILVDTLPLSKRKSIYQFMKHMEKFYGVEEFDIENFYDGGGYDEMDEDDVEYDMGERTELMDMIESHNRSAGINNI